VKGVERREGEGGRGSHMRVESCTVPYPYVRRDGDEIKVKPRNEQRRQLKDTTTQVLPFPYSKYTVGGERKKENPCPKMSEILYLLAATTGSWSARTYCILNLTQTPRPRPSLESDQCEHERTGKRK